MTKDEFLAIEINHDVPWKKECGCNGWKTVKQPLLDYLYGLMPVEYEAFFDSSKSCLAYWLETDITLRDTPEECVYKTIWRTLDG